MDIMDVKDKLNQYELRVLGCLIEKQLTTPAYYPLTLNSLVNACNQRSNREPVVSYSEADVRDALDGLMARGLATRIRSAGSRSDKFGHLTPEALDIAIPELAIMAEIMLRGPQTPGELNQRAGRMAPFETLEQVHLILDALMGLGLIAKLDRQPGRKEHRYAHLLGVDSNSGPVGLASAPPEDALPAGSGVVYGGSADGSSGDSVPGLESALEARVSALESEVSRLRQEIEELKHPSGQ